MLRVPLPLTFGYVTGDGVIARLAIVAKSMAVRRENIAKIEAIAQQRNIVVNAALVTYQVEPGSTPA